ncbi:MAG: GIY-YIG nuclease family protein [Solirubrobacterales bacterium]
MAKVEAPRVSSPRTVQTAYAAVCDSPTLFDASDWPEVFEGLAKSGLYSWWVDTAGARQLSEGIDARVKKGCLYFGQAGGTLWPNGNASHHTLLSRIEGDQLNGITARSAFRRSLAAALKSPLALKTDKQGNLLDASETKLSAWMHEHLSLAVFQVTNRDEITNLESQLRPLVNAQLSSFAMPKSKVRVNLAQLREDFAVA